VQRRWIWWGALAAALLLYLVRDVLPPFLIAFAIAALLDPVLKRMQRRGWSRRVATVVVFVLFLVVFTGVALVLIPAAVRQATEFAVNMPAYYGSLAGRAQEALAAHHALLARLRLPTSSTEILARYQAQITRALQNLASRLLQLFAGSISKLPWMAIIPIVTFYLLQDMDPLRARVVHMVPERRRARFLELAERVGAVFSGYVRGLIIVCAGYAVVTGAVLALLFRLPYSLMIALVSGVLYAVPYVGAVATIAIAALVAVATQHAAGFIFSVVVTMLLVNQLFDQVVTPRVVGGLVGLHPVVSLFALTAGGQLFGLPGMILAVPVAASVQVILTTLWPQLAEPLPPAERQARLVKDKSPVRHGDTEKVDEENLTGNEPKASNPVPDPHRL
jgi:predicted PurR-regulated permease PerM